MSKELEALEHLMNECCNTCLSNICGIKDNGHCRSFRNYKIIEKALKRIPKLEKEIEDTHKSYSMAVEKHIEDENEYIKWVQEGGYDQKKLKALEIIKEIVPIEENAFEYDIGSDTYYFLDIPITKDKYDLLKEVLL